MHRIVSELASRPSLGFISTYPPTRCGLATFTGSMRAALCAGRGETWSTRVVRIVQDGEPLDAGRPEVIAHLDPDRESSVAGAASRLNSLDAVIVQHEFGVFGADDGIAVLRLLERIERPTIVVLHTVPAEPTFSQKRIIESIGRLASATVVMSGAARDGLLARYRFSRATLHVIPHGAHEYCALPAPPGAVPRILTWGLLGPGKGIEWGIRALPGLRHLKPRPVYSVWGQTHPNVLAAEGERYRSGLLALAERLGVADMLEVGSSYLDDDALATLVGGSDVVLLPYDSREQATSGVLIDAVAAGKPVVATRFPHAVELLAGGAGRLVEHERPDAMAAEIATLLTDRTAYAQASAVARRQGASTRWSAVAQRYESLLEALTEPTAMEVA